MQHVFGVFGPISAYMLQGLFRGLRWVPIVAWDFRQVIGVVAGCARLIPFFANTLLAHFLACVLACVTHVFTCESSVRLLWMCQRFFAATAACSCSSA